MATIEKTEPCACPFPLDEPGDHEPTLLTGHEIVELEAPKLDSWVARYPGGSVAHMLAEVAS
jgi:hypothetical protein